jgi:hypothetical protein
MFSSVSIPVPSRDGELGIDRIDHPGFWRSLDLFRVADAEEPLPRFELVLALEIQREWFEALAAVDVRFVTLPVTAAEQSAQARMLAATEQVAVHHRRASAHAEATAHGRDWIHAERSGVIEKQIDCSLVELVAIGCPDARPDRRTDDLERQAWHEEDRARHP